jgi:hypothetical protein
MPEKKGRKVCCKALVVLRTSIVSRDGQEWLGLSFLRKFRQLRAGSDDGVGGKYQTGTSTTGAKIATFG